MGKYLGISEKIINAAPTDGLWNDGRNDLDQLGMSYQDLEKAMINKNDPNYKKYLKIFKQVKTQDRFPNVKKLSSSQNDPK